MQSDYLVCVITGTFTVCELLLMAAIDLSTALYLVIMFMISVCLDQCAVHLEKTEAVEAITKLFNEMKME